MYLNFQICIILPIFFLNRKKMYVYKNYCLHHSCYLHNVLVHVLTASSVIFRSGDLSEKLGLNSLRNLWRYVVFVQLQLGCLRVFYVRIIYHHQLCFNCVNISSLQTTVWTHIPALAKLHNTLLLASRTILLQLFISPSKNPLTPPPKKNTIHKTSR